MYIKAYDPYIKPMPGMKQWEPTDYAQPLPPSIRKLPGRPSLRKRKKEADEEQDKQSTYVKRPKRQNQCSNCGQLGHYKTKCNNAPTPPKEKGRGGRPQSTDAWTVAQRGKKDARVSKKVADAIFVSNPIASEEQGGPSSPLKVSSSLPPWTQSSQGSNQAWGQWNQQASQPPSQEWNQGASSQVQQESLSMNLHQQQHQLKQQQLPKKGVKKQQTEKKGKKGGP